MSTSKELPSEAQRLEGVAEAGAGAQNEKLSAPELEGGRDNNVSDEATPHDSTEMVAEKQEGPPVTEEPKRSKGRIALIMLALCLSVFLAALDITIVTTALPTIAAHFKASQADYTWVGSAYLLAAAAATPSWGKVSDIFGRKPVLLVANVVFFIGSAIAAASTNIQMLLAGRVIQGIGGGGLIILVNICIGDLFSMRNRGAFYGIIGMVWAIASGVGPILGGVFTEFVTWRWTFYINLPLDGLCFIILLVFLDIETPKTPLIAGLKAIDWLGSLLIVGGTLMLLFGLEFGGVNFPWKSATVVCLIVFGLLTIGLFALVEWKFARYPVMPTRIFKYRSNIAALTVCFVHGFVFISGSYFLPLYFQAVLGASPLLSGVYLFPFVLSLSFVSAATGVFIKKTGRYLPPIWFGMFFMTLGFGLFINLPPQASWARIIIYQIIAGVGVGPNFQAPLIALQSKINPRDIATATATFGFMRNLATSISVVVGGVVFQNEIMKRVPTLESALGPQVSQSLAKGNAGSNTAIVAALPPASKAAATQVYTDALQIMWIVYVCIAVIGLAASFLISKQTLSKTHEVTKTGLAAQEAGAKERKEEESAKKANKAQDKENGVSTAAATANGGDSPKSKTSPMKKLDV